MNKTFSAVLNEYANCKLSLLSSAAKDEFWVFIDEVKMIERLNGLRSSVTSLKEVAVFSDASVLELDIWERQTDSTFLYYSVFVSKIEKRESIWCCSTSDYRLALYALSVCPLP